MLEVRPGIPKVEPDDLPGNLPPAELANEPICGEFDDEGHLDTQNAPEGPGAHAPNGRGHVLEDDPEADSEADQGPFVASGFRLESKGSQKFRFRRGWGYKRQTLPGLYLKIEELSEEQQKAYERNQQQQLQWKANARP